MLKFSRFASLTSCLKKEEEGLSSVAKQAISIQCMAQVAVDKQSFTFITHNKGVMDTLACRCTQVAHKHRLKLMSATGSHTRRHQSRHAVRYIPKAQHAFKALLIHGILQFTKVITLRCALHRCPSRDIHR